MKEVAIEFHINWELNEFQQDPRRTSTNQKALAPRELECSFQDRRTQWFALQDSELQVSHFLLPATFQTGARVHWPTSIYLVIHRPMGLSKVLCPTIDVDRDPSFTLYYWFCHIQGPHYEGVDVILKPIRQIGTALERYIKVKLNCFKIDQYFP